ncbi:MbnP family protein [Eisenibacter elegans]|uniref:MbnP family protein n=1 Tax=Eisenibacter elegans TaxID=997 RepID=UPI000424FC28|nr:MbnP family protein [Eisenibacter elegans]
MISQKQIRVVLAAFIALAIGLQSCNDKKVEDVINPNETGKITLKFDNVVGTQDLQLNNRTYTNAAGEEFTVSMLNYFISNVVLIKEDGSEYIVPQADSYFLVKEEDAASQRVTIDNVPAGNYTGVRFKIGVDSLRSTMPPAQRTGALDVGGSAQGMYWAWNSGYIFFKFEGTSPQAPAGNDGQKRFRYHIGGFGGYSSPTFNNIQSREISFGRDKAVIRASRTSDIHIIVDLLKVFNSAETRVSIAANPTVMMAAYSVNIAKNYARTFEYDHLHNMSVQ